MHTPTDNVGNDRILVFAPIGRDAAACVDVLHRAGFTSEICKDLLALQHEIALGAAVVLVAEEGLFGRELTGLFSWVESQPPWSDLPFVVLTGTIAHPQVVVWRQQLIAALRNVSFLERPLQAITLTSATRTALRARIRQYEVRALFDARERAAADLEVLVQARTHELEQANLELHRQMIERARVEESLRQAQKIEAVGQLTGGVAHDFNNLLMVITGGLDMLRRTTDPDRRQMLMDGMLQAAERGAGLTRQLLAFSRRQSLQPQPIDLAHQIEGMRQLLDRSLRGNVHVSYELDDDLWAVKVDPGELELVILNLAVNARDAMPSGGTITIRASNVLLDVGSIQGEFVSLSVIDTGIGMSAEIKDRVFEPYFTTKEVGKGSGLGLAQVYGFAQQSGGGVEIESEVGRGTTVRLVLPRSYESPTRHAAHADGAAASRRNACLSSVLLVEDNEEVAALVREMFLELGYEVTRVASAKAALGALANGRRVDIVFSDIMMPGDMDGLELAREIHMRRPNLPIVLTSGYTQRALREAEAQGLRILRKPYRIEQLAHTITAALEASQLRSIAQNSTSL